MSESELTRPDDLQVGDTLEVDGHTYEVDGTGPAEASLQRVDNEDVTANVFRWAVTGAVEFEQQRTLTQEEFNRLVDRDTND